MKWRRFIFLVLWIVSLVGISYYGGAVSYGVFWGLTLIPCIAFSYLALAFFQFKIYQTIKSRSIIAKQPMPYYFVLSNETFFPFASVSVKLYSTLSTVKDMVDGKEYQLLPGDEHVFHTQLVCKYRGEYEVGVKEITLTDIFGLFRFRYHIPSPIRALVEPRILHLEEIDALKEVLSTSYQDTPYSPIEPDVVTRDYMAGDALKLIHWKASAKEQKLKTRKMLGERRKEVVIVFDTRRYSKNLHEYLPLENQILEVTLAIGSFLAEKNIGFSAYYSQKGPHIRRVESFQQFSMFFEDVSNVIFSEDENIANIFVGLYDAAFMAQVQTLILIVHEINDMTMKQLQNLAHQGISLVLYVVTNSCTEELLKYRNSRLKIIVLPTDGDLEELL